MALSIKLFRLSLFVLSFSICTALESQNFRWVKNYGPTNPTSQVFSNSITLDSLENVYTVGSFTGTMDFDPGPATFSLTAAGIRNPFITKFDSAGNFIWAKAFSASVSALGLEVSVDPLGNVFVSGQFFSTTDFDPGSSTYTLTASGIGEHYICKLDAAGNFIWVKTFKLQGTSFFMDIVCDGVGGVYAGAVFNSSVDVDPGPAATLYTTASSFDEDSYLLRLNSAGNLQWSAHIGSTTADDIITVLSKDVQGAVYAAGYFQGTVDFDPGPGIHTLTSAGVNSFLIKLNSSGSLIRAQMIGSALGPGGLFIKSLDVNNTGIYYMGNFGGNVCDFDPGPSTYTLAAINNIGEFVSRLDTMGNFVYVTDYSGTSIDLMSISADTLGNAYLTGFFTSSSDFDRGAGVYSITSVGGNDIFVTKIDLSGTFGWAVSAGGNTNEVGSKLASSKAGITYITGNYTSNSLDFDPGSGTALVTTLYRGSYVWKLSPCVGSLPVFVSSGSLSCTGLNSQLNTLSPASYLNWYASSTSTVILASGNIFFTPTFTAPGTYTYYVESVGCAAKNQRAAFAITVNASPTLNVVASPTSACAGSQLTLTASGAQSYSWSSSGGFGNFLIISPLMNTTYTVYGSQNACVSSKSFTASVIALPSLSIVSGTGSALCTGGASTLTALGALTYSWINIGVTTPTIWVAQLIAGTVYNLTGTNAAGCTNSLSAIVNVPPSVLVNSTNSLLCEGETATLSAVGANSYVWSTTASVTSIPVMPSANTVYSVTGTSSITGCSSLSTFTQMVSACSGIKDVQQEISFALFPSPTEGRMTVQLLTDSKLEIHNMSGELITACEKPSGNSLLDLTELPKGVYVISIQIGNMCYKRKIIKI